MKRTVPVVLTIGLLGATALAGVLASDPNAYTGGNGVTWCGTETYTYTKTTGEILEADIDYCVYAPGEFTYAANGYDGWVPVPGEFVYAYQIFGVGDLPITEFDVHMLPSNEANNIGTFWIDGSGTQTSAESFGYGTGPDPETADFYFDPGLVAGNVSCGLVYTSINEPLMDVGWIQDGGVVAFGDMASPSDVIPEPTTLLLLAAGGMATLRRRR